jgi:hypothetical protein
MPYTRLPTNPTAHQVGQIPPLSYTTPYGATRDFEISIGFPDTGAGSYPLIIYCHGGASGANPGAYKTSDWARVYAEYGYIVVMISHTEPGGGQAEVDDLTTYLGFGPVPQGSFKYMNYLKPFDIDAVLNARTRISSELSTRFAVSIDTSAGYALAGHSSGSGAVVTYAGATRYFPDCSGGAYLHTPVEVAACHLAYSIQGPADVDNFCAGSWSSIAPETPVLAVTGAGDRAGARDRRQSFAEMVGTGNSKYGFWLRDQAPQPNAPHGFFNHKNSVIQPPAVPSFATEVVWMEDVSLAFLDYYLKAEAAGQLYLDNDDVVTDSAGQVEWDKR